MTITKAELINNLAERGHSITPRRVTDWREKGLLPELKRSSKGRAANYFWEDRASIIAQSEDIIFLLQRYGRVKPHYLSLWFLGNPISPSHVHPHLVNYFQNKVNSIARQTEEAGGEIRDALSQIATQSKGLKNIQVDVLELYLNALFNSEFDSEYWKESPLWEELLGEFTANSQVLVPMDADNLREMCIRFAKFINEKMSPGRGLELVESASEEEILRVHKTFRMLNEAFKSVLFLNRESNLIIEPQLVQSLRYMISLLGPHILCVELSAIRTGKHGPIAKSLRWFMIRLRATSL